MGLLDRLKKSKPEEAYVPTRRDIQKAIFVIGCAITMADGQEDDAEITRMKTSASRMPLFGNNTTEEDEAIMQEAASSYDEDVLTTLNWAIGVLQHQNWCAVAACYMCDIMMADGDVDEKEFDVYHGIAQDMSLKREEAEMIYMTFNTYYQQYEG